MSWPKTPRKPDVMVVDMFCEKCGHRPGKWWINDEALPLPVPEESAFVRMVSKSATHDGCGGRCIVATEPLP